jgi:hypothetical protein
MNEKMGRPTLMKTEGALNDLHLVAASDGDQSNYPIILTTITFLNTQMATTMTETVQYKNCHIFF